MYLLVVTTFLIAIIGIYAQVAALQTARMAAGQSSIGQAMLQWHTAGISMASSIIKTNTILPTTYASMATAGCYVSYVKPTGASSLSFCPSPENPIGTAVNSPQATGGTITKNGSPTVLNKIALNGNTVPVHLDSNYNYNNYQFYSLLFQATAGQNIGQNFVLTFVPMPSPSGSLSPASIPLTLATNTQIGLTSGDLLRQLSNTNISNFSYGTINATSIPYTVVTAGTTYVLPAGFTFNNANGAPAIITSPDSF
jgi:hypothetical protein